jgi:serine/threonine protein kinase
VTVNQVWRVGQVVDERYEVVEVHEGGGMGVVYRVRHLEWGTDLAVKCPRVELFGTAAQQDRFITEAGIWVSLGLHPNVCGCHYVRTLDGVPRVFAEYVAGGSLAEWIADRRLYAGERSAVLARVLDIAIQTAWGLEHAHAHGAGGLVHQDVKPANVLLDVSSDGELTAKVTDFGLAKARAAAVSTSEQDTPPDVSALVTVGGMTIAYASPEQADQVGVGRRSDIYSFAVSVLEMFTGGVTWMAGSVAGAALAAHRTSRPSDPDLPELPAEVALLLERCLLRDFRDRPSSMAAVADELAGIYCQVVGEAYPRAHPVAADLRSDELNNHGLSLMDLGKPIEASKAFEAAITTDPRHLEATYNDGLRQWRSGAITDVGLVSRLEAARVASGDSWLARYLLAEVHLERGDLTAAHELLRTVEDMAPEQPKVARALRTVRTERPAAAGHATTRAMSWHEYEGPGIPRMEIRFTADGRWALAASGRNVGLWDVHSGQCLVRLTGQRDGSHIDVSADGRFALCGSEAQLRLWDLTSGRALWKASTHANSNTPINAVSLSADGRVAAAVLSTVMVTSDPANVMIWDARNGRLRLRVGEHIGHLPVELSPDGRHVLTVDYHNRMARLWDTDTGACVRELPRDDNGAAAMSISADVRTAAIALRNIEIWDLTTGRRLRTLTGHTRYVRSLSWSGDGRFLLSDAEDGTVRLWELDSGRCLRTFPSTKSGPWSQARVLMDQNTGHPTVADVDTVRRWALPSRYLAPPQLSRPRRHAELAMLDANAAALVEAAEQAITAHRYAEAHGLLTKARGIRGYERAPRALSAWRSLAGVLPRIGVRASWQVREFDSQYHSRAVDLSADGARRVR